VVSAAGTGLSALFEQVLDNHNGRHYDAYNLTHFENGGVQAVVEGETVLLGSATFLKEQGIEIPENARLSFAVYMAIDGELSGLFAISYDRSRATMAGLGTLCSYRQLKPILADGDFLVSPGFLRAKFGINPNRITVANGELRDLLSVMEPDEEAPVTVLSTKNSFASLSYGLTGARALHSASFLGLIVNMAGGIIGIGIMLTLTILGATALLTPLNVILYQLIWSVPGFLLTEWTRLL
jgi:hypothetical protein